VAEVAQAVSPAHAPLKDFCHGLLLRAERRTKGTLHTARFVAAYGALSGGPCGGRLAARM